MRMEWNESSVTFSAMIFLDRQRRYVYVVCPVYVEIPLRTQIIVILDSMEQ